MEVAKFDVECPKSTVFRNVLFPHQCDMIMWTYSMSYYVVVLENGIFQIT